MSNVLTRNTSVDKPPFNGKRVRLGDVCEISSGGTPKRSVKEYWDHGTIPWVKISDIKQKYVTTTEEMITNEGLAHSSAKLFESDTLLFSIFASIGAVGILRTPAATNQAIAGLKIKSPIVTSDYLYHWLKAQETVSKNAGRGVAQNNINLTILRNMELTVPDGKTQEKIAAHFATIEKQLLLAKNQLEQLDQLVKSRFIEVFGDPCKAITSNLPSQAIKEFCDIRIGPFGSTLHKEDYVYNGHPIVNPSHIIEGQIKPDKNLTISAEKYDSMSHYHLYVGDVVLGRRGEIGRCAVVKQEGFLCGTGSMILRPNALICRSDYLQRVVSFPSFATSLEKDAVGVTMKNLNAKIVGDAVVTLPPLGLQQEFADFVTQVDKSQFVTYRRALLQYKRILMVSELRAL